MASNYERGMRKERQTRALLESEGYTVCPAKGSKGKVDLVAWNSQIVRFIQVKYGTHCSSKEKDEIRAIRYPPYSTAEVWYWKRRAREPIVTIVKACGFDWDSDFWAFTKKEVMRRSAQEYHITLSSPAPEVPKEKT